MIITKSWLNEWIDLNHISTDDLAKKLNSIGLEVDSIRSYNVPKKIVFGKVLECEKHPDAEKLSICKVDIGATVSQIVCGASNVRAGLDVVVATIGAVMSSGMVIKPVVLRGVESNGMICSANEIGLDDFQSGILELDKSIGKYELGEEVCQNQLFHDDIIEIELTANRGDCLSIRGVARDLSAAFDRPLIEKNVKESEEKRVGIGRILSLSHENDLNVDLKYKAVDLKELKLPLFIKLRLAQIGEKKESDIESLISYAMHSSGVVLKAYDYEFLNPNGAPLAKISLCEDENSNASVFVSREVKASTVGVAQEKASKASKESGLVLLEASYIPPEIISKKMQNKKITNDAVYYRTSRGSEPELNHGLEFCINLLETHSLSSVYGGVIELENSHEDKIINLHKSEIDEIIGFSVDKLKITKILKNLGFNTTKSSSDSFIISVPMFRHDISNKQDIVEEIVRLVGIDNIPSKPFVFTEENRLQDDYFEYKRKETFRKKCASSGFFEAIHFVFDEKKVLQNYGFETLDENKELLNPIISTLDTLRTTLLTGLLKSASNNAKNGYSSIRLFEIGSVFNTQREESSRMALLFSGNRESDGLQNSGKPKPIDFGFFAQKISDILGDIKLSSFKTKHSLSHPYQCAEVFIDGLSVGEFFRVHPTVESEYDLGVTYMCELDFEKIKSDLKTAKKSSKYQASFRDLSIIMPQEMSYEKVKNTIEESATDELIRFYPVDRFSSETLGENISLTIRFMLQSFEKTLEEEDITNSMNSILEALNNKLGIGIR